MDEIEAKKREFCIAGNLQKYKKAVSEILDMINAQNCKISYCQTCDVSSIAWSNPPMIRVSFKVEKPIHIIWNILHEFGHFQSGARAEEMEIYDRELLAWNFAAEEVKKIDELQMQLKDFYEYQNDCLRTYKPN
jgi:hypothetical protein